MLAFSFSSNPQPPSNPFTTVIFVNSTYACPASRPRRCASTACSTEDAWRQAAVLTGFSQ